jgi:pentose-5-phosphate-3-epimerase
VLVRGNLTYPQKCVQSCHAAMEAAKYFLPQYNKEHPHLVVCEVKTEDHLKKTIEKLNRTDIQYKVFREPDIGNELTAIATEPLFGDKRKFFKKFQLLK